MSEVAFENVLIYEETEISGIFVTLGIHFEDRRIPLHFLP